MTLLFSSSRLHLAHWLRAGIFGLIAGYAVQGWSAPVGQEEKAAPAKKPEVVAEKSTEQKEESPQGKLPLDELRTFTEVMQRIKNAYVEDVDDKTLLENAIKGMLTGLDPHSAYLKPDDFKDLEISTSGQFGGLGIEVGTEDGFIKVISPIDDTPAQKAGIQPGDLIIKLDGTSVKGMSLGDSVDRMRGKAGEPITLTIVREGAAKPLDIVVKRAIIKVQSVKSRMLEDNYGYIRLSQFQADSDKEVVEHIGKLKKKNKKPLDGLVLDLRNNPGGVLQAAVGVVDAFIKEGLIVYTEGRIANAHLSFSAEEDDPSEGMPLVVLINGGSASASEIVAGALQDHHRAVLLGTQSFGKGSVQTVLPLSIDNEKGLKLTTALYYTPNGRSIQAEGIKPDIFVPRAKVTPIESSSSFKEADLQGHLDNGNGKDGKKKQVSKVKQDKKEKAEESLAESDYQLSQALNVLKGLHIGAIREKASSSKAETVTAKTDE
ncbi:peptidase S41 [Endozoicomonas sp. OPT23]|uniref:S41 family peptidase n=1 Tax=Endozoicomonas sp. OPT23 TaxID=2072845 RepID=UPI00129B6707|nr:S41 family peptidase [Endozoicomonas sp. OPT23]MRI32572.1 peptidase S41 [Endozoicomonas sp. OPT23]